MIGLLLNLPKDKQSDSDGAGGPPQSHEILMATPLILFIDTVFTTHNF